MRYPVTTIPPQVTAYKVALLTTDSPEQPAALAEYRIAYAEARRSDWPDLARYAADNDRLRALPDEERQIVFLGDSITENWLLADPAFFAQGWINRGISGQTTPQILLRFQADVAALTPQLVHIMAGTNDIAGNTGPAPLEAIVDNITAMVRLAKAAGIRVVLAATPPAARFVWAPELEPGPRIAALNDRLEALAAREGVVFVDYAEALAEPDGAMKAALSFDGAHPDVRGYAAMAPLARAAIERALH